jgi:hypothetical protein
VFVDVVEDVRKDEGDLAEAVIRFEAIVYKVQTLADGGIRLTLDMPETAIPQMAMLAETKREGVPLEFVAKVKA